MRLYLASDRVGDFGKRLYELIHGNPRTLVISNARDHRTPEDRKIIVEKDMAALKECGLIPTELDLRQFFGKADELQKYINEFKPGCIFAMGGNNYSLSTALHLSGMDDIIRDGLKNDEFVYAGYSAGAICASKDLMNYYNSFGMRAGDRIEETKALYGEVYTNGLGIIDEFICPHADEEKFREVCIKADSDIRQRGLTPITLNNPDVVIVDGEKFEILRKAL